MPGTTGASELRGRQRERDTLDRLLHDVRAGRSRVLVLRGEQGAGRTALLDHLIERAAPGRVTRTAGVEPESEISYAALQQLCAPLMDQLDRLPEPQRAALSAGLRGGHHRRGRRLQRAGPRRVGAEPGTREELLVPVAEPLPARPGPCA